MNFSTFYLIIGVTTLITGLVLRVNGYEVLGRFMPLVLMFFVTGILLKFFERLIAINQRKIPSYEEILKIYNKMLESDKKKQKK
jgi:hypothetical protein